MSSTSFLKDAAIRHQIFVQRFAGGQVNEAVDLLKGLQKEIEDELKKKSLSRLNKKGLDSLYRKIQGIVDESYTKAAVNLSKNMKDFGEYESDFSARMLSRASDIEFKEVASKALTAALADITLEVTPGSTLTMDSALKTFSRSKANDIVRVVKDGVTQGLPVSEISDNVLAISQTLHKRQLDVVVRTITNQVSQTARQLTIYANTDIVKGIIWVSTLDGRTSGSCRSLDGKKFPVSVGPRPPIHWNCRSTTVPFIKEEHSLPLKADRPSIGADGKKDVDSRRTYNSWLKRQPASFQDDVLGPTRGKLFREGGLSMDKFVDRNYQELSLDQLKRKEPLAFEKAGFED